jgi:NAD(P)-dependent dehydrogenase (short-subunit alcohol dehydrogenase family)
MWSPPRTALVTGANRGIGLAIAHGLAARGDVRVLAAARRMEDARAAAATIGAEPVELDLANPVDAETTAAWLETTHGAIDILVNNAAVLVPGDGPQVSTKEFARSLAVNTVAPFALMHALGPGMQARGWGRIVNLSSGWGAFAEGMAGPAAYATSKAALNAVTCSFAQSLGPSVKVNAACPGWVRTRMGGSDAPRSPEQGAETPIWLATLPDDGPTGGFFRDRKRVDW